MVLDLTGVVDRPVRICHIDTAGGDQQAGQGAVYAAGAAAGADVSFLTLFPHPNVPDIEQFLLGQDAVWVGGGSAANLLALWTLHGVDRALRAASDAGVVLAGGSAGGLCWFTGGITSSFGPDLAPVTGGLGLLPGSFTPHADSDPTRLTALVTAVRAGRLPPGVAVDEGVGLLYRDGELVDIVTENEGGAAHFVRTDFGDVTVDRLPARLLG